MPKLAARLLGAHVATAQTIHYMAAAHRISPFQTRKRPHQLQIRLYHEFVGFLGAVCHLKASVGSTAPVKEHKTLNDPGRAVFDKTPVSIIFDVIGCILFFRFVGKATQVAPQRHGTLHTMAIEVREGKWPRGRPHLCELLQFSACSRGQNCGLTSRQQVRPQFPPHAQTKGTSVIGKDAAAPWAICRAAAA